MILRISKFFGSRGGATEILTMISVQNAIFYLYQQIYMPVVHSIQLITMVVRYIFTVWTLHLLFM